MKILICTDNLYNFISFSEALDILLQEAERCKNELTSNPKINFKLK